jgi:Na+-translocating ferredoxin:NAD+ oxidoreductase subunit B
MSDSPYVKLRSFLNKFPLGFPETRSGVELKILRRLFTEKEAELNHHASEGGQGRAV